MFVETKLSNYIASDPPLRDRLLLYPAIGIELEYENIHHIPRTTGTHWDLTSDGSLRTGGIELISRPLFYSEIEDALNQAETLVLRSECIATPRCGLHTHMNMRPFTIGQIWSVATTYTLIEPTLYQTYAIGREESTFAVPLWLNRSVVTALGNDMTALRSREPGGAYAGHNAPRCRTVLTDKYSALNFQCLVRFGTIEMRQPYCSTDFEAIRSWCEFVTRLQQYGCEFSDPRQVLSHFSDVGLETFQRDLFGDTYIIDPDIQEMAEDAASIIVGHVVPHWDTLDWQLNGEG